MKYKITVSGCDAEIKIEKELTDYEFSIIEKLCEEITKASTYVCEPTMYIEKIN